MKSLIFSRSCSSFSGDAIQFITGVFIFQGLLSTLVFGVQVLLVEIGTVYLFVNLLNY